MKMMPKDRARAETEKRLDKVEKQIGGVYSNSPALLSVQKEYVKYMAMVKKRTEGAYKAYIEAEDKDTKAENKKAYMDKVYDLYQSILNGAGYKGKRAITIIDEE